MSEAKPDGGGPADPNSSATEGPGTSAPLAGAGGGGDLQADLRAPLAAGREPRGGAGDLQGDVRARLAAVREQRAAAGVGPDAAGNAGAGQAGGGMGMGRGGG